MAARANPGHFELDVFLRQQDRTSLLRFIACGSVDHGKSTLIGRLLYEAKLLFEDQLDALTADSRKCGTQGKDLDFSLILDGLAAEREQKITIDVAYRFFTTERRKFIVADAPGHEQYTRNMATGASTADLALILVDAGAGLTRQTRRHSLIVSTLGVRRLVVAVSKMDLVDWSKEAFCRIESEFRSFAEGLNVAEIICIPISARSGDNVVTTSCNMDWYRGPTLLAYLERAEIASAPHQLPFRLPVQLVNRPTPHFRGYSGLIASGEVHVGMPVRVLPSDQGGHIDRIVTYDGDVQRASAGQSVTITLAEEIDISRGDVITDVAQPAVVTERLTSRVVWMDRNPLVPGRNYLIKLGTSSAKARFEPTLRVLNLDTRALTAVNQLGMNDIGHGVFRLDRPIAVDPYRANKETGSFILIDPESCDTVGMGFVEAATARSAPRTGLRRRLRNLTRRRTTQRIVGSSDTHI